MIHIKVARDSKKICSDLFGPGLLSLKIALVKSHGEANQVGFGYAIDKVINEVTCDSPEMITRGVAAEVAKENLAS
jgi:fatty acid/phospholipid biosynthesis enzyme